MTRFSYNFARASDKDASAPAWGCVAPGWLILMAENLRRSGMKGF